MPPHSPSLWPVRLITLALWALAAASVVAWALRFAAPASPMAAPVAAVPVAVPDAQAIARLLGAAPAVGSRYTLVGVLAGASGETGAALIAVAGQPAKPFRVGATVDGDLVLQALGPREAQLGPSGANTSVTLALPDDK